MEKCLQKSKYLCKKMEIVCGLPYLHFKKNKLFGLIVARTVSLRWFRQLLLTENSQTNSLRYD